VQSLAKVLNLPDMNSRVAFRITAGLGFFAVALGAFGAHGLSAILQRHGTADIWETAVFYHFIHTVVMLFLTRRQPWRSGAWWCFLAGIIVFSGTLYVLAATNLRWLGAVTPFGGVSLLAGWMWLLICPGSAKDNTSAET
jgi:uncharacterized membrane protein YgdD (TMEM256/DUF423 family)